MKGASVMKKRVLIILAAAICVAAALAGAKTAVTSGAATSVKKAGGYAQIISILCSGQLTSTISGWTGHPYIYLDDPSAIDVRIVSFEEHDPFA